MALARPTMSACQLAMPARAQALDARGRRDHWRSLAQQHGLPSLVLEPAVGPAELPQHVPASVLQSLNATLLPGALKICAKFLGMWATNQRFLAAFAATTRPNATAIFFEDDAILQPSFCADTMAALRALQSSSPSWHLLALLPGHCGGTRVRNCTRIASSREEGQARLWLSSGGYPMCTHAYVVSALGASRLHSLLAGWPRRYAEKVLRNARPGWEKAGVASSKRPTKRPVDIGHDVLVAHGSSSTRARWRRTRCGRRWRCAAVDDCAKKRGRAWNGRHEAAA